MYHPTLETEGPQAGEETASADWEVGEGEARDGESAWRDVCTHPPAVTRSPKPPRREMYSPKNSTPEDSTRTVFAWPMTWKLWQEEERVGRTRRGI